MANPPARPDSSIQELDGKIAARWNIYFTQIESAIYTPAFGVTARRPTTDLKVGQFYYDTTLGYPIWLHQVSPIVWHTATGAVA